ncbi:MAG: flagellar hook-basal body complex protein FliE [Betaproteobacteria bacterium]|nr:flagellar hook-basal body complex protein FliE [Betaproteobacteria bacterium]
MNTQGIDQLLGQLRAASQVASGQDAQAPASGGADFAALLKASIDQVNGAQAEAGKLAQAFEAGGSNTSLQDVMISLQKANLSFQTMVQVRDKLVTAYQDIMNIQV